MLSLKGSILINKGSTALWLCVSIRKYILTGLLTFLPVNAIFSQNFSVNTFTTKDGLAHNNVRDIVKDNTGFLWIATYDGLSRYDGYEFKNYYHIPGDSGSISYFSVKKLLVDKQNNLWILTDRSEIILYDRIADNFKRIIGFNDKQQQQIFCMGLDNNSNLWVIFKNKVLMRKIDNGIFYSYNIVNSQGENYPWDSIIYSLGFTESKLWLIGPKVYEFKLKPEKQELVIENIYEIRSSFITGKLDFECQFFYSLFETADHEDWIFSNDGLFKLDKSLSAFTDYKGRLDKLEFSGKRAFVWAKYKDGIYSYDTIRKVVNFCKLDSDEIVNAIYHQGENSIWIASLTSSGIPNGLTRITFTDTFFKNFIISDDKTRLPAVYSIVKDEYNNLWAGVRGLDHIVKFTGYSKQIIGQLTPELFKQSGHIRSMIRVNNGIWIGYFGDLLLFYDFKNKKFIRNYPDENVFRTLTVDEEGNLFIGNNNLSVFNPKTGKTELIWRSSDSKKIYKLFLAGNDLWAGLTTRFILKYNLLSKRPDIFSVSSDEFHIEDICQGKNNDLWFATLGEGICNFDPVTGKTIYYTTSSGLSNNTTYCVLKDKSGNIWISTDNGISKLNPETGRIRVFNQTDGLEIKEFNSDASYVAEDGEFFFGGMGGFVGFYPDSLKLKENSNNQKILLSDFSVSGSKKILSKPLNDCDTIVLSKGEDNFRLTFSSTDFINSEKTLFRYRLDKINKYWVESDIHSRNVNYANLIPGLYSLEIQATNQDGEWNAGKKITFNILPYFYQTKLFKIFAPLFFVFLISGMVIIYIRQLKQRETQKQDALKLQSLRGQMNPHFIFNSLNSINYFISNNDQLSANRFISDFSRHIRSILSNLEDDYVRFESELNSVKDYLSIEHLRFGDKFDFEIQYSDVKDYSDMEVIPGLIQPFIENAIWHGIRGLEERKGLVSIRFSSEDSKKIICFIDDDGIGRKASSERKSKYGSHQSRGITIAMERLRLINKLYGTNYILEISDLNPGLEYTGTRVRIDLPSKLIKSG